MRAGSFIPSVNRYWGDADRTVYSNLKISGSEFDNCHFRRSPNAGNWNIVRNVIASDVTNLNSSADTVQFENVVLRNLKRGGSSPLFLWGCVFDRVMLEGKISSIKLNRWINPGSEGTAEQALWDKAMIDFYKEVDWALDISAAKFSGSISFESVPGEKVRINPAHQALVRRDKLDGYDLKDFDFNDTAFDIALSWFLKDSLFDSVVLAAATGSRTTGGREIEVIRRLRAIGIAEPNQ